MLPACGPAAPPTRPIVLTFRGEVGGAAFACGTAYPGVGTTGSTFTAEDLRFYVHDVRVVTAGGLEVPVALDDDGVWQDGDVALVDLETGGACTGGNPPTHDRVRGTIPASAGAIEGVRFVLGVPADRNHLEAASQPSPLNLSSLFWGWTSGYKYLRVEGRSTGLPGGVAFHLGATGCTGDAPSGTITCASPNLAEIDLAGVGEESLATGAIVADLAALFSGTDLDTDAGGQPGCLSSVGDPECAAMYARLGLGGGTQTFFRFEGAR